METLNMKDNLLLRWWKPSRVGPRRRGAALLLSPNPGVQATAHNGQGWGPAVADKKSDASSCGSYPAPGCSASECQICHVPFEFGDIMIGNDDGIRRGRQFCYYCAAKAADMFETTDAVIGHVLPVDNGWEVAFAPDCTTWITVRRDEHDEPKVGDIITVTVPKAVAIHSQPNPAVRGRESPSVPCTGVVRPEIKKETDNGK